MSTRLCQWSRRGGALLVLIGVVGCTSSHGRRSAASWEALQQGRPEKALKKLKPDDSGLSRTLLRAEAGRVTQLSGDFEQSRLRLKQAVDASVYYHDGAVIRFRSVAAELAAASLLNDYARPYYLDNFELVMAAQAQSVNYWALGDLPGAMVEVRKAGFTQDQVHQWSREDFRSWTTQVQEQEAEGTVGQLTSAWRAEALDRAPAAPSEENGYAWYWSGLWYEAVGEPGNALISYEKALAAGFSPTALQRDVLRLAARENLELHRALQKRFPVVAAELDREKAGPEIVIILEEGRLPVRISQGIPLPIDGLIQQFNLPSYGGGGVPMRSWEATVGEQSGPMELLANVYGLAWRDMERQLPGVVVRNIIRIATRAVAQHELKNSDNEEAEIAAILWNIGTLLIEEADTRAWNSLPQGE